ncbi:hypothetical protein CANMA_002302 [Candida margitis]|uniref:uncharacterized protein n=1 Tax=Candida margitis TaxID=1775924 RepID=UPI002226C206|nr:uncharacterized protein CANMA_002302 [Candida margitis]KAI5968557.1 hypothetical protein CANMA_002302 [Candida margitis]
MARTRSKGPASPVVNKVKESDKVAKPKKSPKPTNKKDQKTQAQVKLTESEQNVAPSVISNKVTNKAISELKGYIQREKSRREQETSQNPSSKSQLFGEDDAEDSTLTLIVESKKFFSSKPQFKPKTIKLSKSINDASLKSCLILRDQLVKSDEEIEKIEEANLPTISQILPLQSIKTEYKPFEKRRELHSSHDLFFVDDAVLNTMPFSLGKIFYESNKYPIPLRVTTSSNNKELSLTTLSNQLEKLLASTSYLPPQGTTVSIKIGSINDEFSLEDLNKNINAVASSFELNTIKSIMLKTPNSPALPLYYTDSLYDEDDILVETKERETFKGDELSAFEKGLLELGDAEMVAKAIGKKLGEKKKEKVKGKVNYRILFPEKNYKVGRNDQLDFVFNSRKSARELLELIMGPPSSAKTPLSLCIQSRAKTNVNGAILRLSKGESPKEIDYTNCTKITITVEPDSDSELKDFPIIIEWIEVKLFVDTEDDNIKELKRSGIEFAFVEDISDATHFYTAQAMPNSVHFKNAVVRGIPIVNDSWAKSVLKKPNNVNKWLLNCDYSLYLPNENSAYLPEPRRKLLDTKLISFEPVEWLDVIVVEKSEDEIQSKVGTDQFILINTFSVFGFQAVHQADIWNKVVSKTLDTIPTNRIQEQSQKRQASTETGSSSRKRRRYEKVDKLHFFSPSATSIPVIESQDGTTPLESAKEQNTKPASIGKLVQKPVVSTPIEAGKVKEEQPKPEVIPVSPEPNDEDHQNPRKRRGESFTTHRPPKLPKFVPKVSFADAVMKTKEKTRELWEKEMGISEESEGVTANLSNLAIVEVVDVPIRKRQREYEKATNATTTVGKNFKKFVKSVPVKRQQSRPHIEMVIEETTNVLLPKPKHKHTTTMDEDFSGAMSEVRGYEPNTLFVPEDDSDGGYEESITQPFLMSQENASSTGRAPRLNYKSNHDDSSDGGGDDNEEEEEDDDDDDDDQPKFGFSR